MPGATHTIGILQVKAYKLLQHQVSSEVKKFDLNPTQWFILGQISHQKMAMAAEIAYQLKVEAPLITNLTDDLVAKGLIRKVPSTQDKRVKSLQLTPKAIKLVPIIEARLQVGLKALLRGVSDKELGAYHKVLEAIVKNGQLDN